jgi:hypothetical protein
MNMLSNFLLFQAAWFTTVLGAANGMPWMGPVAVLAVVGVHLRQIRRPGMELRLILGAVLLGLVADSLILATGWIAYPNGRWIPGLAPYWIVALWALFATTLNVSMRWMHGRHVLAAVFGAVGGPLSYLAGAKLGAMSFLSPAPAFIALALLWSMAMPLLVRLAVRLDETGRNPLPAYVHEEWNHG